MRQMFVKKFFKLSCVSTLVVFFFFLGVVQAEELTSHRVYERVFGQPYFNESFGPKVMMGYQRDIFLSDSFFAAFSVSGIVSGNQGGFGVVNFGFGYRTSLNSILDADIKGLAGSGGGGGVKGGSGLCFEVQSGLSLRFSPPFFLDLKIGYIKFPTGLLETPMILIGVSAVSTQFSLDYR